MNATIKAVTSPVIAAWPVVSASSAIDNAFIYLVFFVSIKKKLAVSHDRASRKYQFFETLNCNVVAQPFSLRDASRQLSLRPDYNAKAPPPEDCGRDKENKPLNGGAFLRFTRRNICLSLWPLETAYPHGRAE